MSLRSRGGNWHYRFQHLGREWSGDTDLAATSRNRRDALAIEAKTWEMARTGRVPTTRAEHVLFRDVSPQFLTWCESQHAGKPNTWKRIRGSFASLGDYFGQRQVASIRSSDAADFVAWRRRTYDVKDVTIRHDMHALSKFFQWAAERSWCTENVVLAKHIPSDRDAVRINPLGEDDERQYFESARRFPKLFGLGRLMVLQGCRPEELLALDVKDIDLRLTRLKIVTGKTLAAKRTLKLRSESLDILTRQVAGAVGPYVFSAERNPKLKLSLSTVENWHKRVLADTGIRCVIYDLRHTFATRAANGGMSLATLSKILGHGSLRSVMKYVHPDQPALDSAMDALDVSEAGPEPDQIPAKADCSIDYKGDIRM